MHLFRLRLKQCRCPLKISTTGIKKLYRVEMNRKGFNENVCCAYPLVFALIFRDHWHDLAKQRYCMGGIGISDQICGTQIAVDNIFFAGVYGHLLWS